MIVSLLALTVAFQSAVVPTSNDLAVVAFEPESRTLERGETAVSTIVLRNAASQPVTVWIGYSVRDAAGGWYDVPANETTLGPGAESSHLKEWPVPTDLTVFGPFRVVMAVWSGRPGTDGAVRLLSRDREASFRVRGETGLLSADPDNRWQPFSHQHGRGVMRADQVFARQQGFALRLLGGRCDGAEMRTSDLVHFGEYTARIRTPDAPGSLSAFFLYEEGQGDHADEIDIEIYNDGSRRVLLTSWLDGVIARQTEAILSFDPAQDHHDYTIRWSERELAMLADDTTLVRWTSGIPRDPMRLIASVWWPSWLPCDPPRGDRELDIQRILEVPANR